MSKGSAPDPWGSNRHAARPGGASGQDPRGAASGQVRPTGGEHATSWGAGAADPVRASSTPVVGWGGAPGSWSSPGGAPASRTPVGPPYPYLWVSFGAAALALVLAALPGGLVLHVVAWAIAGLIGFGAAVLFVQRDALRQTEALYMRQPLAPRLHRAAVGLSLIAVVATAIRIALALGRMG